MIFDYMAGQFAFFDIGNVFNDPKGPIRHFTLPPLLQKSLSSSALGLEIALIKRDWIHYKLEHQLESVDHRAN